MIKRIISLPFYFMFGFVITIMAGILGIFEVFYQK